MKRRNSFAENSNRPIIHNDEDYEKFLSIYARNYRQETSEYSLLIIGEKAKPLTRNIPKRIKSNQDHSLLMDEQFNVRYIALQTNEQFSPISRLAIKYVLKTLTSKETLDVVALTISEKLFFTSNMEEALHSKLLDLLDMVYSFQQKVQAFGLIILQDMDHSHRQHELYNRKTSLSKQWSNDPAGQFLKLANKTIITQDPSLDKLQVGLSTLALKPSMKEAVPPPQDNVYPYSPKAIHLNSIEKIGDIWDILKTSLMQVSGIFNNEETPNVLEEFYLKSDTKDTIVSTISISWELNMCRPQCITGIQPIQLLHAIKFLHDSFNNKKNAFDYDSHPDCKSEYPTKTGFEFCAHVECITLILELYEHFADRNQFHKKYVDSLFIYTKSIVNLLSINFAYCKYYAWGEYEMLKFIDKFADFSENLEKTIAAATMKIDVEKIVSTSHANSLNILLYLKQYPNNEQCVVKIAEIYAKMAHQLHSDEAAKYFIKSLKIDPEQPALYDLIGKFFVHQQQYIPALAFFQIAHNSAMIKKCTHEISHGKNSSEYGYPDLALLSIDKTTSETNELPDYALVDLNYFEDHIMDLIGQ